eukprot:3214155-Amphidinium_carterae.1
MCLVLLLNLESHFESGGSFLLSKVCVTLVYFREQVLLWTKLKHSNFCVGAIMAVWLLCLGSVLLKLCSRVLDIPKHCHIDDMSHRFPMQGKENGTKHVACEQYTLNS